MAATLQALTAQPNCIYTTDDSVKIPCPCISYMWAKVLNYSVNLGSSTAIAFHKFSKGLSFEIPE